MQLQLPVQSIPAPWRTTRALQAEVLRNDAIMVRWFISGEIAVKPELSSWFVLMERRMTTLSTAMWAITTWLLLPWPIRARCVALPGICGPSHLLKRLGDQLSGLFAHHCCLEDGLRLDENLTNRPWSTSPFTSTKVFTNMFMHKHQHNTT